MELDPKHWLIFCKGKCPLILTRTMSTRSLSEKQTPLKTQVKTKKEGLTKRRADSGLSYDSEVVKENNSTTKNSRNSDVSAKKKFPLSEFLLIFTTSLLKIYFKLS
jgi:hypothetical protein